MIKPRPYTEPHCSADRGGTSGTTVGPRTKRNASQGMRVSRGTSSAEAAASATGGSNVAWYTISPRSFCVRTVAFQVRRSGSASDSNPHVSARPSNAERSRGVCSATERAPANPPPSARHLPAHTRHSRPAGSGAMVLLETPPITTSSTRSKTAAAAAAASAPPPRRPSRSTLAPEEASVAAGAEDEASEPSVVPPRERSGGATRPTATARRAYAGRRNAPREVRAGARAPNARGATEDAMCVGARGDE